jgi:hypothetical protein
MFAPGLLTAGLCTTDGYIKAKWIIFTTTLIGVLLVCLGMFLK